MGRQLIVYVAILRLVGVNGSVIGQLMSLFMVLIITSMVIFLVNQDGEHWRVLRGVSTVLSSR